MVTLNTQSLTVPVGIIRLFEFALTLITFSLVASEGTTALHSGPGACSPGASAVSWPSSSYSGVHQPHRQGAHLFGRLHNAFAMLSTLMLLAASVIYPTFLRTLLTCGQDRSHSDLLCVLRPVPAEVDWPEPKPGEISGFLSTVPGLLKGPGGIRGLHHLYLFGFGAVTACFLGSSGVWLVYSICFSVSLSSSSSHHRQVVGSNPDPLDKCLTGYNVLAVLMYLTAVIIWPVYSFQNASRPPNCRNCFWSRLVVVSCMTCINLIVYIVDTVYSVRLVFFVSPA